MGHCLTETVVPLLKPYLPDDAVIKVWVGHVTEIYISWGTDVDYNRHEYSIYQAPTHSIQLLFQKSDQKLKEATLIIRKLASVLIPERVPHAERDGGKILESIRLPLAPKYPHVTESDLEEQPIEDVIHRIMTYALERTT